MATPNDFGLQGEPPTHPQLLDWLALELIRSNWSLKHLHRLIMNSSVYMQSDEFDEARSQLDRDNRLHWRHTPRRLEAEAIRDAMLEVSGLLDETMYGPGSLDESMNRRSIYFTIKRSKLIPMMMLYDWPEHLVSIGTRPTTTTAPQALALMNSKACRTFATGFAEQLVAFLPADCSIGQPRDYHPAIQFAYHRAYGRDPTEREFELATSFLEHQIGFYEYLDPHDAEVRALIDFGQTMLSSNEFVYVR